MVFKISNFIGGFKFFYKTLDRLILVYDDVYVLVE